MQNFMLSIRNQHTPNRPISPRRTRHRLSQLLIGQPSKQPKRICPSRCQVSQQRLKIIIAMSIRGAASHVSRCATRSGIPRTTI